MTVSDAQAIALLIGAATTAIATLGAFYLQVLSFRAGLRRDLKLAEVHTLVNGQSEALREAVGEKAFTAGRAAGQADERHDPHANPLGKITRG